MSDKLQCYLIAFALPPFIVFFLQAILNRLIKKNAQLIAIISMVIGYLPFFTIVHILPFEEERVFAFYLYLFLIYSLSAYTYFHLFNMSETSRRIRLLMAVPFRKGLVLKDVEGMFDDKGMILARLERLEALRQIRQVKAPENSRDKNCYICTGYLLPWAGIFMYRLSCFFNKPWKPVKRYLERGLST